MKPIIGITLGDLAGIGPEVVVKALASRRVWSSCYPVIYGPPGIVSNLSKKLKHPLREILWGSSRERQVLLRPVGKVPLNWISCGKLKKELIRIAVDCVRAATKDILEGKIHGLVTAPVHKVKAPEWGIDFVGHTELLAQLTSSKEVVMMMASSRLKLALVTTHIPIRNLSKKITYQKILITIRHLNQALKNLGIRAPKIGVAAFNPHGDEDGGKEEKKEIRPAILQAQREKIVVEGPLSADALFCQAYHGFYDGVVVMYHDQGLVPLKMIAFDEAVNVTLGLPFIRTSPDHGTAYDIAGKGIARPESMIQAILTASAWVKRKRQM
ncbi:MAG: 4-hydroxythreonine-4-phosphate dehydrogenase PdxA [Chlamydiae bacterium]|nr:4-hydroxythreonine-4-phosphate dehydrogenase PdxA [Chlamydiota bacterium]MBI3276655.1 4-hydroxythreonine-4-phosphate dehydrogenase PdxA [Chlamydiota bacterium]